MFCHARNICGGHKFCALDIQKSLLLEKCGSHYLVDFDDFGRIGDCLVATSNPVEATI